MNDQTRLNVNKMIGQLSYEVIKQAAKSKSALGMTAIMSMRVGICIERADRAYSQAILDLTIGEDSTLEAAWLVAIKSIIAQYPLVEDDHAD